MLWALLLACVSHVTVDALETSIRALLPPEARTAAADRARTVVDGKGLDRVLDALLGAAP